MSNEKSQENLTREEFIESVNLSYNLAFEVEFRKTKVKVNLLDEYLEEVSKGVDYTPEEFVGEGLKRTMTPVILSIIKEKLRRFVKKYGKEKKSNSALVVLLLLQSDVPPGSIPFFIAIFARSAVNRPLSDNDRVWKYLYMFLPGKVKETDDMDTIESPDFLEKDKEKYDRLDSGILIPKKKEGSKKDHSGIILTDGD